MSTYKSKSYDKDSIKIYDAIGGIRENPNMYVGADETTAHHLFNEVMDNSVDEFLNGFADGIWVTYDKKTRLTEILDNGRGLPIDYQEDGTTSTMEAIVTNLHAGGKFSGEAVTGGTHGVGITVVNALSSYYKIISIRGSYQYELTFERGEKTQDFTKKKKESRFRDIETGTYTGFIVDKDLYPGKLSKQDPDELEQGLMTRAYTMPGLRLYLGETEYYEPNGIEQLVTDVTKEQDRITDIYYMETNPETNEGNYYQIAFTYTKDSDEDFFLYTNGIRNISGTHESGFKRGWTTEMKKFINENNYLIKGVSLSDISSEDTRKGLVVAINVGHGNAKYSEQSKQNLVTSEVGTIVGKLVTDNLPRLMARNPKDFKLIADRVVQFAKGRKNAAKYEEKVISSSDGKKSMNIMDTGKFVDCYADATNPTERDKRQLIIVEGDSAGGNIKQERDPKYQALFPLRGKIKMVADLDMFEIIKNKEINDILIASFGTNDLRVIQEDPVGKSRFGKYILLADADPDGKK